MNTVTPWLDGTGIYGPNRVWESEMRAYENGRLKGELRKQVGKRPEEFPARNYAGFPLTNHAPATDHKVYEAERLFRMYTILMFVFPIMGKESLNHQ